MSTNTGTCKANNNGGDLGLLTCKQAFHGLIVVRYDRIFVSSCARVAVGSVLLSRSMESNWEGGRGRKGESEQRLHQLATED
jgi:hypothetical protein